MSRPRILDAYCKQGGAGMGYHRAGFDVVGVDIDPQPRYPFEFHQADALEYLSAHAAEFDAIHASPPCQAHVKGLGAVNAKLGRANRHTDLIPATRKALRASGLPYVIENVEGAPLENPVKLCGSSFGLAVRRHRLFESNVAILVAPCAHHLQTEPKYWTSVSAHRGSNRFTSRVVQVYGNGGGSEHWPEAMGIDWMDKDGLTQAIPPAYTEHIGGFLLTAMGMEAAA